MKEIFHQSLKSSRGENKNVFSHIIHDAHFLMFLQAVGECHRARSYSQVKVTGKVKGADTVLIYTWDSPKREQLSKQFFK